jgi:flagellar basal body P-ring formation protein FlgA
MNIRVSFLFAVALLVSFAATAYAASPVATLKTQANVASDIVKLGDLIDNAGPAAAIPVFHAPEFGTTGTIQTHRIVDAARANGILIVDTRGVSEIVVSREGRTIPVNEIERAIAEAAVRQIGRGQAKDFTPNFGAAMRPLLVEASTTGEPRIAQFHYEARTQRFSGVVEITDSAMLRKSPVRVSGVLVETADVVALARNIERGETIRESDIYIERRPRNEITGDTLSTQETVIGQAAKRALRGGQPLRAGDLMKPDLVTRNDVVTIVFESGGVTLTMRGKALASGTEGETISVLNPQSKRTLQATVDKKPGVVVVGRNAHQLAAESTGSIR